MTEAAGMRIAVTGAEGQLGNRLVHKLLVAGNEVVALDQIASPSSGKAMSVCASIFDNAALLKAFKECDVVCHLAALTHAHDSGMEPMRYFDVNTMGTLRVLEACRQAGVRHMMLASTGLVYGDPQELPVRESHPCRPSSVYASSKLAAEEGVRAYARCSNMSTDIIRLTNLYGPQSSSDTVIGMALNKARGKQPLTVRDTGVRRDFLYVDDAIEAMALLALQAGENGQCRTVNVSSGQSISLLEVLQELSAVVKMKDGICLDVIESHSDDSHRIDDLVLDNSMVCSVIPWKPSTSLFDGLTCSLNSGKDMTYSSNHADQRRR